MERAQRKKVSINNSRLKAIYIKVKGKHYAGNEFQTLAVRGKKLLTDILIQSRNGYRKIMQPLRIMSGPATRMRKWNQFSQSR